MSGILSNPTHSPLRELLGESELGQLLDQLNADPWIGPTAPGDGDLVSWYSGVCLLALGHAMSQELPTKDMARLQRSSTRSSSSKTQSLQETLWNVQAAYGRPFLKDPAPESQQTWDWLCTLIDEELALQWGGRRVRIKKKQTVPDSVGKVERALKSSIPIEQIAAEIGISRATVYRILKRKA